MQEYPEDTGRSMSQVFHGEKMLHELPSDIRPPAVKVNNKIYFLNEVLQCLNGQYFIPERFCYSTQQHANNGGSRELFAQGHAVRLVDVHSSIIQISHIYACVRGWPLDSNSGCRGCQVNPNIMFF